MRITSITIFLILLITAACDTERSFSIPEENYFVKFYGEEGEQEGVDFIVNPDGTIVMVGNTERQGVLKQIYVVKVDANGHLIWQRSIGLPDKNDFAKDIELHPDGRIVIAGETEMGVNNRDVYIKTMSQDGNELDSARVVLTTFVNPIGILTNEEVVSVSIITNGFIVSGASTLLTGGTLGTEDTRDAMHLRFDNSLNKISGTSSWKDTNGGVDSKDIAAKVLEILPDSVYFVFGSTNSPLYQGDVINNYDSDFWIFQLNSVGISKDQKVFGDKLDSEILTSVEISPSELGQGYLLTGISTRTTGFSQSYIVKINRSNSLLTTGKIVDAKPIDIGTDLLGKARTIGHMSKSYLILSDNNANLQSSILLQKLNPEFSSSGNSPIIFASEGDDFAGSISELPNGRILIMGTMTVGQSTSPGQKKMVLMKLNPNGKLAE